MEASESRALSCSMLKSVVNVMNTLSGSRIFCSEIRFPGPIIMVSLTSIIYVINNDYGKIIIISYNYNSNVNNNNAASIGIKTVDYNSKINGIYKNIIRQLQIQLTLSVKYFIWNRLCYGHSNMERRDWCILQCHCCPSNCDELHWTDNSSTDGVLYII